MIDVTIFERVRETVSGMVSSSSSGATSGHDDCLQRKDFDDLFKKVSINGQTYIQANYGLYSTGSLSGYGLKESGGSSGGGSVDVEQILAEGVEIAKINGMSIYAPAYSLSIRQIVSSGTAIATINGLTIYAPEASSGGGASTWDELTGKPSWLTDAAPGVSTFGNDAGYVTSSELGALASLSTVGTEQITNYAVTEDKIASAAVTAYQLAAAAVQTAKIADGAVTEAKIADGAVTAAKIADGAVTVAKLAQSSMTLWGGEVALGGVRDGDILLGSGMGVRFTDGEKTAWLRYDAENNALYVADGDGNAVSLYATGSLSGFGYKESSGSTGDSGSVSIERILAEGTAIAAINGVTLYAPTPASLSIEQILTSGTAIATINGMTIYAPTASSSGGGGASTWDELSGKPSWVTATAPAVSTFGNDVGYITAAQQVWQEDENGCYYVPGYPVSFDDSDLYIDCLTEINGSLYVYYGSLFYGRAEFHAQAIFHELALFDGDIQCNDIETFGEITGCIANFSGHVHSDTYVQAASYVETTSCYAQNFVMKPYSGSGAAAGSGAVVTPLGNSQIYMSDADLNGCITMLVGGTKYLEIAAAYDYIYMLKDIRIDDDKALRIGNAYLRWDATNNALYVTGQNGAQVNFYATGGLSGYSALGTFETLANLDITGQLTAASVKTNLLYLADYNIIRKYTPTSGSPWLFFDIDTDYAGFGIGGKATYFDIDGWLFVESENKIVVHNDGILNVGGTASTYDITGIYADGSYVYITINGKRYRLTPSATTTV